MNNVQLAIIILDAVSTTSKLLYLCDIR